MTDEGNGDGRPLPERIGRYRIIGELGRGGMGRVLEGFDDELQRPVAIKGLLRTDGDSSERHRERLRREALATAALSHPGIAHVYEIIREDATDWLVMERMHGTPLSERLMDGPLPVIEAARIGAAVASALTAAHEHGVIHRDIKPSNVILGPEGRVTVIDFGLALRRATDTNTHHDERLTATGTVVGTSRTMSPEQARGLEVDHRSDIFSLGSLVYEMVSGRPPFSGQTVSETLVRVGSAEHTPLAERCPHLPSQLTAIVDSCLQRDPDDRYQSAATVGALLEALVTDSGDPTVTSDAVAPAARRHRQRWPVRTSLTVGAVLLLVVAAAGWWWSQRALEERTVALLPVTDAGGEASALTSTAVSDALAARLARLEGLQLVAGREVRAVLGEDRGAVEIASLLGVDELVEASVTPASADRPAQVTLSRIDGEDATVLWADTLELYTDDLVLIQDQIATALGDAYRGWDLAPSDRPGVTAEALRPYLEAVARLERGEQSPGSEVEIALLEEAVAKAPEFLDAIVLLTTLHGLEYQRTDDPAHAEKAIEHLRTVSKGASDHPKVIEARIRLFIALERHGDASEVARAALDERPGDAELWKALAMVLEARGEYSSAAEALKRAIELRPSWWTDFRRASILLRGGDHDAARLVYLTLLGRTPDHPHVLTELAFLEQHAGDYEAATVYARRAVAVRGHAIDHNNLGVGLFYSGHPREAVEHFQKAAELAPTRPAYLASVGDAWLWSGEPERARQCYARALEAIDAKLAASSRPPRWSTLATRALCLAHLGRGAEAVRAIQDALEQNRHFYALYIAAAVSAINGDRQACLAWTESALEAGAHRAWFAGPEFAKVRKIERFNDLVER
jgi:serine/threonine-protein kinase